MVVRITSLKPGRRTVPFPSVHDCACIRVLKTSNGNVTCAISPQPQSLHDARRRVRHTSHAVTPAIPPAAMSSAHVRPELSSASASSINESWCRCRWADGVGGGGGFIDLKNRHAASYLHQGVRSRNNESWVRERERWEELTCRNKARRLCHGWRWLITLGTDP